MFDLVSVILPTKDRAQTLSEQLEALSAQTYRGPWELILADNGSTDETLSMVSSFADRLPLRVVIANERPGASYARNRAAELANGEFLFFVDDDDRVDPGWLAAMALAAEQWDVVRGNNRNFRVGRHGMESAPAFDFVGLPSPFGFLPSITGSNSGIRRELFAKVGGFDESYPRFQDTHFYWRAQLAGHPAGFVVDAIVDYRLRAGVRTVFVQTYREAKTLPRLYREFRVFGMPRSSTKMALRASARILKHAPHKLRSELDREELARELGGQLGRIVGSIRHRALYL